MIVVGVGNRFRSDDGLGPECATRLAGILAASTTVVEQGGDAAQLLETLQGADDVILIDAVQSGAAPGTIFRLDPRGQPLPREIFAASTHAFGVPEAIELARAFDELPRRIVIYAVEGASFSPGTALSPEVERALDEVVHRVAAECVRECAI